MERKQVCTIRLIPVPEGNPKNVWCHCPQCDLRGFNVTFDPQPPSLSGVGAVFIPGRQTCWYCEWQNRRNKDQKAGFRPMDFPTFVALTVPVWREQYERVINATY